VHDWRRDERDSAVGDRAAAAEGLAGQAVGRAGMFTS
jgi:hypothetical protein